MLLMLICHSDISSFGCDQARRKFEIQNSRLSGSFRSEDSVKLPTKPFTQIRCQIANIVVHL